LSAEELLMGFVKQSADGERGRTPYRQVIEKYLQSEDYRESVQQNKRFHRVTKLPLGEQSIEVVAHYIRTDPDRKVPPRGKLAGKEYRQ